MPIAKGWTWLSVPMPRELRTLIEQLPRGQRSRFVRRAIVEKFRREDIVDPVLIERAEAATRQPA